MNDIDKIKRKIRDIQDFPKEGILFRDITPLLADAELCQAALESLAAPFDADPPDAIAGIESRGFLFGMLLAARFGIPFIPVRKSGKLPYDKISHSYSLEYGKATIEMHTDAIRPGMRVLIHDDLLATGGTAAAAASLANKLNGTVLGFSFLLEISALEGRKQLGDYIVESLIQY